MRRAAGDAGPAARGAAATGATRMSANPAAAKIECNACPVLCQISEGRSGACDRYANVGGVLTRVDPVVLMRRVVGSEQPADSAVVPFNQDDWRGEVLSQPTFVTGIGAGTTYPDYKPAPFIVSSRHDDIDMVTVVTEGIFSY
ncbi:MAG TPA: 6-hydroxynicotinate reductase, partial [Burkholderiaceae bacterium]|nr:6-hydroxynicotinate reductase [Burkholderiaceae bacterium]